MRKASGGMGSSWHDLGSICKQAQEAPSSAALPQCRPKVPSTRSLRLPVRIREGRLPLILRLASYKPRHSTEEVCAKLTRLLLAQPQSSVAQTHLNSTLPARARMVVSELPPAPATLLCCHENLRAYHETVDRERQSRHPSNLRLLMRIT